MFKSTRVRRARPILTSALLLLAFCRAAVAEDGAPPKSCPAFIAECASSTVGFFSHPDATQQLDTYSCSGAYYGGKELVYAFTAAGNGDVTVELTELTGDFDLFVLSNGAGCDGGNCVDSSTNAGTGDEQVTFPASAGETYYFSVEDYDGNGGTFTISVTECPAGSVCIPSDTTLCLPGDNRFEVTVYFDTVQGGGNFGFAQAIPLDSLGLSSGGSFYFSNPTNPEFLVKVLNGCALNGHFWVFYAATTNVGFEVSVLDTATDTLIEYTNPDIHPADTVTDTHAFPCP